MECKVGCISGVNRIHRYRKYDLCVSCIMIDSNVSIKDRYGVVYTNARIRGRRKYTPEFIEDIEKVVIFNNLTVISRTQC